MERRASAHRRRTEVRRSISPRVNLRAILRRIVPLIGIIIFVVSWQVAVWATHATIVPGPIAAVAAIGELGRRGLLVKYVVASLFRVTWGYFGAMIIGIPAGIALGLSERAASAVNPYIQILRPISPLAWIPIAILWFGVGDVSAIFLIFIASLFPIVVTAMHAVHNIDTVHLRAGANFGLTRWELVRSVIFPAILPQLLVGMRIALGIAWLVVVAAEMIAVNSGLGFLIIDARNAGNRYDLVVAGMILIGAIGVVLDLLMRQAEKLDFVRWGYAPQ